ncbi:MAG: YIP1 family protein [Clostridia bacterium]|nr:YIP1 family protein [Clostridia bacterium]
MKKKMLSAAAAVLILLTTLMLPVGAKSVTYAPYDGYEYNDYNESTAAPIGYLADTVYDSAAMGLESSLYEPTDMIYVDGALYILDGGNGRIVELDGKTMQIRTVYGEFKTASGEVKDITGARGMTLDVDGTHFYIANSEQCEVLKVTRDGTVVQVITRPDHALLDTEAQFLATKVVVDQKNRLYVLVESINMGAFVYDANGEFLHFFGSNPIVATGEIIKNYFWKRFMTKEARQGLARVTPTTFENFDIDQYGFLYTVTGNNSVVAQSGLVRRLNYKGSDILTNDIVFGDVEWDRVYGAESLTTSFADVDIDSEGYINLLDEGRGRVFQYTTDGKLIAEFGTYSEQVGGFSEAVAIETIGDRVYVLDSGKKSVISFRPTEYGAALREAFKLLSSTETEKAYEVWMSILKKNTNSQYPYYGIGMVYDAQGRYKEAMEYFKLAGAHVEYSKALREYRIEFINTHYLWLILGVAVLVALVVFIARFIKKRTAIVHGTAFSALETKYMFPVYTCMHPSDGFEQFKTRKIYSMRMSALFVVLWFFLSTMAFFYTGYSFNKNRAMDYQFLTTLFMTVGLFVLFVVANWSVCTLMNGKGSLKEITATCAYALVPYLISILIRVLLSNVLTVEESAFLTLINLIGLLWSLLILFIGLQSIHQYSFWGTIGSVLLTLLGMAIICFLLVLFYTLVQQAINFIRSIGMELSLR